jgi:hypothetical protein
MSADFDPGPEIPWFSFDEDERRDGERVVQLEWRAKHANDPAEAVRLLAEADKLRERWDVPRQRFSSLAEMVEELQALARDALALDPTDHDAIDELGGRLSSVGGAFESLAIDLESAGGDAA